MSSRPFTCLGLMGSNRAIASKVQPDATDDLRPPNIRSTQEGFGGQWQRLDLGTPAITWSTCWPQPDHVALPHLRHVTCRHMGRSSSRVDGTSAHYTPWGLVGHICENSDESRTVTHP